MFLLSDIANRIRTDLSSLPSAPAVEIRLHDDIGNLRKGDERALLELLILTVEKLCRSDESVVLELGGTDGDVRASFRLDNAGEEASAPLPPDIKGKVKALGGRLDGEVLLIPMPAATDSPVVDLKTVVERTGLSPDQARSIASGFIEDGRRNLAVVSGESPQAGRTERIRAAHSLKGTGKSMCAFELAAAAAAVEDELRDNADPSEAVDRLEGVWERVEEWYSDGSK